MAKEKMHDIDDGTRYVEAYRLIGRCTEAFNCVAPNIPRNRDKTVSEIFWQFNLAVFYVLMASNDQRLAVKLQCLSLAKTVLFYLQASFFSLVCGHACTVGQINTVIPLVKDAYAQITRWHKDCVKKATLQGIAETEVTAEGLCDFIRLYDGEGDRDGKVYHQGKRCDFAAV